MCVCVSPSPCEHTTLPTSTPLLDLPSSGQPIHLTTAARRRRPGFDAAAVPSAKLQAVETLPCDVAKILEGEKCDKMRKQRVKGPTCFAVRTSVLLTVTIVYLAVPPHLTLTTLF